MHAYLFKEGEPLRFVTNSFHVTLYLIVLYLVIV